MHPIPGRSWMVDGNTLHRPSAKIRYERFEEVDKVLLEMYLITRDSGKVKRLLKSIAMRLDVIMWHLLNLMEHAFKTTNIEQSKL